MTDYKEEISSTVSDDYRMDIYDVLRPHFQSIDIYLESLHTKSQQQQNMVAAGNGDGSTVGPDRLVFIDGILQSRRSGDASYHETLVHPTMFAHSNPKQILILGGGSNAVAREVLKHNTVQKLVMIEQEYLWKAQKEFLPDYSDCSKFVSE